MGDVVLLPKPAPQIANESLKELEELEEGFKRGDYDGLVFIALHKGSGKYTFGITDRAKRCPTYSLGTLAVLYQHLMTLAGP